MALPTIAVTPGSGATLNTPISNRQAAAQAESRSRLALPEAKAQSALSHIAIVKD